MNQKKFFSLIFVLSFLAPLVSLAEMSTLDSLLFDSKTLASVLEMAFSGLCVAAFFYGLVKFIWNSGDAKKREEGKGIMTWGVIAMFVLVTIWGIIGFMQASIGNTQGPGQIKIVTPVLP